MTLQSLDIKQRSASPTTAPEARNPTEIAQLIDVSVCIGCKACQVACSEWNELRADVGTCVGVYDNPTDLSSQAWTVMRFAEVEENGKLEWLIRKDGCMHCTEPGCLKACPSPGAIVQFKNGIVDFHQENCIGCGYCVSGCPFNVPRLSPKDGKAYKCNMCSDRVAVGLEPACVKTCPTGAIQFGSKEDMKEVAAARVADLKSRGYRNAGLYDPPGVGGTHTMYVLHHADTPEQYSGLPADPAISTAVGLWKGPLKPLATVGLAAAGLFGFFHYTTVGPNRADGDTHETHEEDRS
ncbi:formate dehydrogenase subunit beta [Azospirillum sp. TSO22-1]|uniref:formate dehydrogenase subunit beta n=1 Tax=Azospirillum sp. TSO22-1 TaxID=716789 RepID=UPI000D611C71|nr:formate dehydrogenase subunit beta [Azospirillum sp. TSO22-1]PWC42380.1 formate dehydrogenase [Azospirillum sp. TSO22-1]